MTTINFKKQEKTFIGSCNITCPTAQKMKFFLKDFFSKCDQIHSFPQNSYGFGHITEEIFNRKLHFLCSVLYGKPQIFSPQWRVNGQYQNEAKSSDFRE